MMWEDIRQQVLKRDNYTCQRCGAIQTTDWIRELNVHHIIPRKKGGMDDLDNLKSYCGSCHHTIEPRDKVKNAQTKCLESHMKPIKC